MTRNGSRASGAAASASPSSVAVGRVSMVDATLEALAMAGGRRRRSALRKAMQRKSPIAFLMPLPLILLVALLVPPPAFYSIHPATLNKSMERFVGFGNFLFL